MRPIPAEGPIERALKPLVEHCHPGIIIAAFQSMPSGDISGVIERGHAHAPKHREVMCSTAVLAEPIAAGAKSLTTFQALRAVSFSILRCFWLSQILCELPVPTGLNLKRFLTYHHHLANSVDLEHRNGSVLGFPADLQAKAPWPSSTLPPVGIYPAAHLARLGRAAGSRHHGRVEAREALICI